MRFKLDYYCNKGTLVCYHHIFWDEYLHHTFINFLKILQVLLIGAFSAVLFPRAEKWMHEIKVFFLFFRLIQTLRKSSKEVKGHFKTWERRNLSFENKYSTSPNNLTSTQKKNKINRHNPKNVYSVFDFMSFSGLVTRKLWQWENSFFLRGNKNEKIIFVSLKKLRIGLQGKYISVDTKVNVVFEPYSVIFVTKNSKSPTIT